MTILFDFNRTLYDPETGELMVGAYDLLSALSSNGHVLHLISKFEPERMESLQNLGIRNFFQSVSFVPDKSETMRKIIESSQDTVLVVGDHLHGEIRIGNRLGARTVWLKRGRFSSLEPEGPEDQPWATIEELTDILRHIG